MIRLLLILWSVVALVAAIVHLWVPLWTAAGTIWSASPGWQQEIAFFDILLACVFLWLALRNDPASMRVGVLVIVALSLVLGLHHLSGWVVAPKPFHIAFTLSNFVAVTWGAVAWLTSHRRAR